MKKVMKKVISLTLASAMVAGGATQIALADDGEKQTIVYWAQWSETETQADVLKDAIARFEEANPEYTVEVNWAGRDVRDIMRTSIESGITIDVIESGYDRIVSQLGEEYCQNITEYVQADTDLESTITEGMISFSKSFTSDGESWYYIPAQPFIGTIFYNKAIFREAGIDTLPTTWSEFMDVCQKLVDAGYAPLTTDDAYVSCLYGAYLGAMIGYDGMNDLMSSTSSELWDDPAIEQMANDFAEMAEKGYFAEGTGSYVFPAAQNTEFALGTTAMYYNGSWLPNEIAEITGDDFEWGAMYFPSPDGATDPYETYTTGCQFYAVPTTAQNVEGAVKLIAEFTSEQTQMDLLEKCQCIPVISGLDLPASLADCGTLMEDATNAVPWTYCTTASTDVSGIMNAAFAKLIAGEETADEFIEEIHSQMN
jgi:raffinose/stachyose/melibiose transport system substrate-binding protein